MMLDYLNTLSAWLWNPLFVILTGTGLYLTFCLRGIQFTHLFLSLKHAFMPHKEGGEGEISHFEALMTALAATIGIGNIAGVATAIAIGGLGSIFWLWVTALVGMALKYGEAALALTYRTRDANGEMAGGPMYYIEKGLGWKWLALFFAVFGICASLFIGNIVQANSIAAAAEDTFHLSPWTVGAALALLTGVVLIKGIQSIGKVTAILVPVMAGLYILSCLVIIGVHYAALPETLWNIVRSAFNGQAAFGGFTGSTMIIAMQMGVTRGVFSNESGLGSAPIAAAAAKSDLPGHQALIAMSGAFLSTVVCTFTALAIGVTHVLGQTGPDGSQLSGTLMTIAAFNTVIPFGSLIVTVGSFLFGYSTILGWAYYGEKCCEYLFGVGAIKVYRACFPLIILLGVGMPLNLAWVLADLANGLMALPNLIALALLARVVVRQKEAFYAHTLKQQEAIQLDLPH